MAFDNLLLERDGAIATVTINRPKVLNALNAQTMDELRRVILDLKQDEAVRVVILTGAGEKSFVAGADINELAVQTPVTGREHALAGQHVFDLIENMGKPVIAAINGFALGRRVRAGDGLHAAPRGRHREARPARNRTGTAARLCRHAAPAAACRQGQGDGDDA